MSEQHVSTAIKGLYAKYKFRSNRRGIQFILTHQQFLHIVSKPCYLCGSPPAQLHKIYRKSKSVHECTYNGIDRLDNTKGYTFENSMPCCSKCNRIKSNFGKEELFSHIAKILSHFHKGVYETIYSVGKKGSNKRPNRSNE